MVGLVSEMIDTTEPAEFDECLVLDLWEFL